MFVKIFQRLLNFSYGVASDFEKFVGSTKVLFLPNLEFEHAVRNATLILRLLDFCVLTFLQKFSDGFAHTLAPRLKNFTH